MRNMKKVKKEKTKEELIRSNKARKVIIIILALVLAYFAIGNVRDSISNVISPEINGSINSNDSESETQMVDYIKGFVYGILSLEYPFIAKFLIFLGVIYLVQIALSITGDIIQLVLIVGVAIVRFIRWIYRKIKRIENEEL